MAVASTKDLVKEILQDKELISIIVDAVSQAIHSKFKELFDRMDKQDAIIFDLQKKADNSEKELKKLRSNAEVSSEQIKKLQNEVNDMEQYSRRNIIRIFGVKEVVNENTDDHVLRIANNSPWTEPGA